VDYPEITEKEGDGSDKFMTNGKGLKKDSKSRKAIPHTLDESTEDRRRKRGKNPRGQKKLLDKWKDEKEIQEHGKRERVKCVKLESLRSFGKTRPKVYRLQMQGKKSSAEKMYETLGLCFIKGY